MNKIRIKRLICTSLSGIVLGTSFFVGEIPKANVYAADNVATATATKIVEPMIGAGQMCGILKSIQNVNDYINYGEGIVATINNGNGDYLYFAKAGTQSAEDLKNITIGQNITINYVLGTPVQCNSKWAFPITSISTAIKQTTYTDSQGVIYQLNENDNTAIINSQTAISGDIVIPQQVTANGEQYTITAIGENAFGKCSNLKSIVIPDSVTRIGQYAFHGCTNLENVILPKNLTIIEERIFSGCSSLKSIILPENIKNIEYHAFYGCDSLVSITIPSTLTFIGINIGDRQSYVNTFIMSKNNNNFTTQDGVIFSRENSAANAIPEEPGYREVCGVGNYTGTIKAKKNISYDYFHDGIVKEYLIVTVTSYTGYDCSFFVEKDSEEYNKIAASSVGQHIELEDTTGAPIFSFDDIDTYAAPLSYAEIQTWGGVGTSTAVATGTVIKQTTYTDSQGIIYKLNENDKTAKINIQTGISGNIVIPQEVTANGEQYTVTGIGENAFGKCSNLKSIAIPDSVTTIGTYAFYGCSNLESVTLPNNLVAIGERTFSGCSSLKSIVLPDSIKDIGYHAFYGCDSLVSITIPNSLTFIGNNTADRLRYVNTFIMKRNNNNFTTQDGVIFSRENSAVTATPEEPGYREVCGVGNYTGTIKAKKNISYDYFHDGIVKEYLILTVTSYTGYDCSFFVEKDSEEYNKIAASSVGQHIELEDTTGTPIFNYDGIDTYAAPLSYAEIQTWGGVGTSTAVATGTETATSTVVATGTETATSTVVATGTETSATSTVATSTETVTGGNVRTGDTASLMTVAMFMVGSAGILFKKGKK